MSSPKNQPILKPVKSTPLSTVIFEPCGKADMMVFSASTREETQDIVAKDGATGNEGYHLRYNNNGWVDFILTSDGTNNTVVSGSTTVSAGTWYHAAGIYDGST